MGGLLRLLKLALGLLVALFGLALVLAWIVPLPAGPDTDPRLLASPGTRFVTVPADPPGDATAGDASAGTITTAVLEMGPANGRPVVFVHGFGGSTFSWRTVLAPVAASGFRAVAIDLADFGLSEKRWEVDTSHAAQARLVLSVMDRLGIRRAVLVGHSMGGNVVTQAAMLAPDRVAGLVLVDAAIVPASAGQPLGSRIVAAALEVPPIRQLARQLIRRLLDDARFTGILQSAYADPAVVTPAVVDGYLSPLRTKDWDLGLLAIVRDGGRNALPAPLSTLKLPTLIVWGGGDPWIPVTKGEELKKEITGSQLFVQLRAGHLPMEEAPDEFVNGLLVFLGAK